MSLSVNDYLKYDLYNIFLITKHDFNLSTLRKAYQRHILIYHPDKFPVDISEEEKLEKYNTFHLINNAYTILSNEQLRKEYDTKRDLVESEQNNFINLKSQFKYEQNKYINKDEYVTNQLKNSFDEQMNKMNQDAENVINSNSITDIEEKLSNLQISRENTAEILNYYKVHSENPTFLETNKISPLDNFKEELSNMNTNRNIKLENNGTELYNSLHSNTYDDEKYASFDQAFTQHN
jgi:curved DNA-binding protein CbpA